MKDMTMKDRMMEQIKEVLEEGELKYDCNERYFGVPFDDFIVGIEPSDDSLEMKLFETEVVEPEYKREMLKLLNMVNSVIKEGHWELEDEERPCFRIYVCLPENGTLENQRIADILAKEFVAHKKLGTAIKRVMYGLSTAEEAFEAAFNSIED